MRVCFVVIELDSTTVLTNHKNKLSGLFFSLLAHSNPLHRSSGVAGLVALVSSSSFSDEEVPQCFSYRYFTKRRS